MSFKKNNYFVIKNCFLKDIIQIITGYTLLKRSVYKTFIEKKYITPLSVDWGTYDDGYINDVYSSYADILTETIIQIIKPKIEKIIKEKIFPIYSYYRIYTKNNTLPKQPNAKQFYISSLLHIGKDNFSTTLNTNNKEKIIYLNNGDLLIYKGEEIDQKQKVLEDNISIQIYFHYTNNKDLIWDAKPHPGLPEWFSKNLQGSIYE